MEELNKMELLELLKAYDIYIQNANEENKYFTGWKPVCINEFYESDFEYYK